MLKKPKIIPTEPGVYVFRRGKTPLYVGKAASLRKRVTSYFSAKGGSASGGKMWKVEQLLREANKLDFIKTESEIAALIKESELIKRHIPKFNILMRDDKNYVYVGITRDAFPRFYVTHQPVRRETVIGPFVEAGLLYETLRLLRTIFQYCTCKKPHRGLCVNAQIGRCKGYCCSLDRKATPEEHKEYKKNMQSAVSILSGKRNVILKQLKAEMKTASRNQEYEKAAKFRDQISGLESLYRHRGIALRSRGEVPYHKIERTLKAIFDARNPIRRVEGYDISNISGSEATGSMVVFTDGRADKSQYRKFKIKTIVGANDVGSHKEVVRRRLFHEEWQFPDVMLIDGGKAQLRAAASVLTTPRARAIHLAALSKPPRKFFTPLLPGPDEHRKRKLSKVRGKSLRFESGRAVTGFTRAPSGLGQDEDMLHVMGRAKPISLKGLPAETRHFLQRVRDESHRFAKSYHAVLRKKAFAASR